MPVVPPGAPRIDRTWPATRVLLAALPAMGLGRSPARVGVATQRGGVGHRPRRARRAPRRLVRPRLCRRRRRPRSGGRRRQSRPSASSPRSCDGSSTRRARCATGNSPHPHPHPEFRHDVNPPVLSASDDRCCGLKQTVRWDRVGVGSQVPSGVVLSASDRAWLRSGADRTEGGDGRRRPHGPSLALPARIAHNHRYVNSTTPDSKSLDVW